MSLCTFNEADFVLCRAGPSDFFFLFSLVLDWNFSRKKAWRLVYYFLRRKEYWWVLKVGPSHVWVWRDSSEGLYLIPCPYHLSVRPNRLSAFNYNDRPLLLSQSLPLPLPRLPELWWRQVRKNTLWRLWNINQNESALISIFPARTHPGR